MPKRNIWEECPCWVYLLSESHDSGFWKIGVTIKPPTERLPGIQTGNPRPLKIEARCLFPSQAIARQVESLVLRDMRRAQCAATGEWFSGNREFVFEILKKACADFEPQALVILE